MAHLLLVHRNIAQAGELCDFRQDDLDMIDQDGALEELQSRMKEDWDERVRHDYRYWMSDGVKNDEEMWSTGQRDFEILTNGISEKKLKESRVLDLGCGVGRILRTVASECQEAVGVDVSEEAIATAKTLLNDVSNARLVLGNGSQLDQISNAEIDIAISFAALGSMPAVVMAGYLIELSRVLRAGGTIRLQVYLGKEQEISEEDTLALRSYNEERFFTALEHAGFEINYKQEVILPFEVSDYKNGIIAYVIGAEKVSDPLTSASEIHSLLIASKENRAGSNWSGSHTAYLVALARAQQQINTKDLDRAEESIRLAKASFKGSTEEAEELLQEISRLRLENSHLQNSENKAPASRAEKLAIVTETVTETPTEENTSANIPERKKGATQEIRGLATLHTDEGSVLEFEGVCLSHKTAPRKAAGNWAKRTVKSLLNPSSEILMVGLGDAYFAEMLSDESGKKIRVFESNASILETVSWYSKEKIELISCMDELDVYVKNRNSQESIELVILPSAPFYLGEEIEEIKRRIYSRQLLTSLNPQVAIVGPLYGGSLPIAEYVYRACENMGLRSSYINLSSYYNSFTSFEKFLKKQDARSVLENQYVELLSELALQVALEKKTDILISVAQAPLSPKVLEKCREKGIITVHWFMEDVNRFPTWKQIAKYYDYFFVIQKGYAIDRIKDVGGKRVHYLPLACDPGMHKKISVTEEEIKEFGSAISFVGAGYNNRRYVFSKYAKDDFKIWGTEWPDVLPFSYMVQRKGARISVDDYIKIFNSSEINLNLHSSHEKNGVDPTGDFVNPRTFELAACKAFQLVDQRTLLGELFLPDEIATFETENELRDKINYFLSSPEERNAYIEKSYQKVISQHTYEHRIKTILEYVYADYGSQLASKSNNDSWNRTLSAARPYAELYELCEQAQSRGEEPTLDGLIAPLLNSTGVLSDTQKKLMFLHHIRGQISQINKLRNQDEA